MNDFLDSIEKRLEDSCRRAEMLSRDLSLEQLNWKISDKRWSVGQCLEHIDISTSAYITKLKPAIEAAKENSKSSDPDSKIKFSITARILMQFVEPTAKYRVPAPKSFKPSLSNVPAKILDKFLNTTQELIELVHECKDMSLKDIRLSSPETNLIRLNAADTFEVLAMHTERHLNQVERTLNFDGFPEKKKIDSRIEA